MSSLGADIWDKLQDPSITSLVDLDQGGNPAIFNGSTVPDTFNGKKSINFYQISPLSGGLEWTSLSYSVNCRAKSQPDADAIAQAVFNLCNRQSQDRAFFRCEILPVIPPRDKNDVYNYPVELFYRKK